MSLLQCLRKVSINQVPKPYNPSNVIYSVLKIVKKDWAVKIKAEIFQLRLIFKDYSTEYMETGQWALFLILSAPWQWQMNNSSSFINYACLLQMDKAAFSRVHDSHLPWQIDTWNTFPYEVWSNTANLKSYYVFDIKPLQVAQCDFTARQLSLNWHQSCCYTQSQKACEPSEHRFVPGLSILTTI